jgi:hypothetical protein
MFNAPPHLSGNLYFFTVIAPLGQTARGFSRAHGTVNRPMKLPIGERMTQQPRTPWSVFGAVFVWSVALAAAWVALAHHQFATEPRTSLGVTSWPASSKLPRQLGHSTLVLFLHPKCPCSRATLSELERLFTSIGSGARGKLEVVVDAPIPSNAGSDWLETDTLQRAMQLPNSQIVADPSGVEAALFGATTSGFVMLFDQIGGRQFSGGITEARGHEGENAGLSNLRAILRNEIRSADGIPAFGCRLCLPEKNQASGATHSAEDT